MSSYVYIFYFVFCVPLLTASRSRIYSLSHIFLFCSAIFISGKSKCPRTEFKLCNTAGWGLSARVMSFTFSWTIKASSCLWAFLLWSEDNTQTHVHVCLLSYLLVVAAITFRLLNVSPHHVQLNNLNCYSHVEQVHQLPNLFRITSLASSYLMTLTGGRFHLTI